MKKKILLLIILLPLLEAGVLFAQKTEGVVSYNRKVHWSRIWKRMTFLSQEEKDREQLTFGKFDDDEMNPPDKMKLYFNANQSLYTWNNEEENNQEGWGDRKKALMYHRNFEKELKIEMEETLGKTYLLEDSLHSPNWRILNEIKDVNGYICMKAETTVPVKEQKIVAWFAQDIPVQAGPERFFGLPGLILEIDINDGEVIIEAQKVELKDVSKNLILPKLKGKKIKDPDFNLLLKNHIEERRKAERYLYSGIRY